MDKAGDGWPWLFGKAYAILQRNPTSNRVVIEIAALCPDDRVLDLGCGAGRAMVLAARLVGTRNVAGVDPTPALASTARKRLPGATVEIGVAEDLPFPDRSFTVAWTITAHHHWDDSPTGLREAYRVLARGGRFLLAEYRNRRPEGHGLNDDEAREMEQTLSDLGFERVETVRRRSGWRTLLVLVAHRPPEPEPGGDSNRPD